MDRRRTATLPLTCADSNYTLCSVNLLTSESPDDLSADRPDHPQRDGRGGGPMSAEAIAIAGVGVTLLAVLVPLLLALRAELRDLRRELRELSQRVDDLTQRVARVEGALAGPWRPEGMPPPLPPGETP